MSPFLAELSVVLSDSACLPFPLYQSSQTIILFLFLKNIMKYLRWRYNIVSIAKCAKCKHDIAYHLFNVLFKSIL